MIEEIENMFASEDREIVRLAQKLCHASAITYYIFYRSFTVFNIGQAKAWVIQYNTTGKILDITYENQYKFPYKDIIMGLTIHKIDYSWRKSKK